MGTSTVKGFFTQMANEATVTSDFKKWLDKNKPNVCTTYEFKIIKLEKKKSFAFSQVAEHQVEHLMASLEGFWLKIPDMSAVNGFSGQKPFDSVWIKAHESYVIPIFWYPRKTKLAVFIPIWEFIKLRATWKLKSIKMDELLGLGFKTVEL